MTYTRHLYEEDRLEPKTEEDEYSEEFEDMVENGLRSIISCLWGIVGLLIIIIIAITNSI